VRTVASIHSHGLAVAMNAAVGTGSSGERPEQRGEGRSAEAGRAGAICYESESESCTRTSPCAAVAPHFLACDTRTVAPRVRPKE
jgi:hypothetical protein